VIEITGSGWKVKQSRRGEGKRDRRRGIREKDSRRRGKREER
jgi:hypothetical protein